MVIPSESNLLIVTAIYPSLQDQPILKGVRYPVRYHVHLIAISSSNTAPNCNSPSHLHPNLPNLIQRRETPQEMAWTFVATGVHIQIPAEVSRYSQLFQEGFEKLTSDDNPPHPTTLPRAKSP